MKLANGSGNIVELNGNRRKPFAVRVTESWKDGKQVRKYIGYYSTQGEAIAALGEYHKIEPNRNKKDPASIELTGSFVLSVHSLSECVER